MGLIRKLTLTICRRCKRLRERRAARLDRELNPEGIIKAVDAAGLAQVNEAETLVPRVDATSSIDEKLAEPDVFEPRTVTRPVEIPEMAVGPAQEAIEATSPDRDSLFERAQLLADSTNIPPDAIPHILMEMPGILENETGFYEAVERMEKRISRIKTNVYLGIIAQEILKYKPELLTMGQHEFEAEFLAIETKIRIIDHACQHRNEMSSKGVNYYEDITVIDLDMKTIVDRTEASILMRRYEQRDKECADLPIDSSLQGKFKTKDVMWVFEGFGFCDNGKSKETIMVHSDGRRISIPDDHGGYVKSGTLSSVIKDAGITRRMFIEMAGVTGVLNKNDVRNIISLGKQRDIDLEDLEIVSRNGTTFVYDDKVLVGQVKSGRDKGERNANVRRLIEQCGLVMDGYRVWIKVEDGKHIARIPTFQARQMWETEGNSREELLDKVRALIHDNVIKTTLFAKAKALMG